MCVAIYKPSNAKFPTRDTLKNCWNNNPDGAGIAALVPAVKKGQEPTVKIIKGFMSFRQLYKTLRSGMFNELETVVHFRWATSGTVDETMTHPFPVGGDNGDLRSLEIEVDKAVIHNGVLFQPKFDDFSDTAIFARWMHTFKPSGNRIRKVLGNDRLAIVCKEKGVKLMGSWYNINGCYFSNLYSHNPYKSMYSSSGYKGTSVVGQVSKFGIDWDEYTGLGDGGFEPSKYSTNNTHHRNSGNIDNSFAYHDSRHEIDEPTSLPTDDMQFCPVCHSENVYLIGLKTHTVECQDCGIVYNQCEWLEPSDMLIDKEY